MTRQIEITVKPTGEVTIDAVGYNGNGCQAAVEFFAKALGQADEGQYKPEFHNPDNQQPRQQGAES